MDRVALPFRLIFWAIPGIMSVMLILAICVCSRASQVRNETCSLSGYNTDNMILTF